MKVNRKSLVLYVIRILELVLTGAAGGGGLQSALSLCVPLLLLLCTAPPIGRAVPFGWRISTAITVLSVGWAAATTT